MTVKYILDEGGLIRELSRIIFLPDASPVIIKHWFDLIKKTRFKDYNAISGYDPIWRVEIAPDVWVVGVFIYEGEDKIAIYYAESNVATYDEKYFSISEFVK